MTAITQLMDGNTGTWARRTWAGLGRGECGQFIISPVRHPLAVSSDHSNDIIMMMMMSISTQC